MKKIFLTCLLLVSIKSVAFSQITYDDFARLITYVMTYSDLKTDSLLRAHGFKERKPKNFIGREYRDDSGNYISIYYGSKDQLLYTILFTRDFDLYQSLQKEISNRFDLSTSDFNFYGFTCNVYPCQLGSFFSGFNKNNLLLVGYSVPIKDYKNEYMRSH